MNTDLAIRNEHDLQGAAGALSLTDGGYDRQPSTPREAGTHELAAFRMLLAAVLAGTGVLTSSAAAAPSVVCNGSGRLCDLPLGSVAFATTHNSMSSPADKFLAPNQGEPITKQLEHGIRGFQIDAFPGVAQKGRVYTDLSGPFGSQATDLPQALVATAERIHRELGAPPRGTPTEVYLCHSFCELGAIPMKTVAQQMRSFLDKHKSEVLAIVIEDYVPPSSILDVLNATHLSQMLFDVHTGQPLPTLGAMVRTGKRLLVSLENNDGGPTLPNAFTGLVEETPYTFLRPSDLTDTASCRPNRGTGGAPVFQLNHWLTPASRTTARAVNSAALRARVKECTTVRGRPPTLVAVDFADNSDVVSVVNELNRGGQP